MIEATTREIIVNDENAGQRIDIFLSRYFKRISRSRLKQYINNGKVFCNGQKIKPSVSVAAGDVIEVREFNERPIILRPEHIPFDVCYYDEHLIVLNKPHGLVVHPGKKNYTGTLVNAVLYRFGPLPPADDPARPGIVHRLDKDTSGVMLVARTPHAYEELKRQFKAREVTKTYLAGVHGVPRFTSNVIHAPLAPSGTKYNRMQVVEEGGKDSETFYQVVEEFGRYSILRVFPKTGRMHQIRVHLRSIGHPVLCDPLYGSERSIHAVSGDPGKIEGEPALERLFLHAARIEFAHPVTGEPMVFDSDLPAALKRFRRLCERNLRKI